MRQDFEAVCGRKGQDYPSKEAARRAITALRRKPNHRGRLDVYPCPFSKPGEQHFHVGHITPAQLHRKRHPEKFGALASAA